MDELIVFLQNQDVEFYRNKPLSKFTSIGIGGKAEVFIVPSSKDKFLTVLKYLSSFEIPFFVSGNMTNVLPSDDTIKTVIVSTCALSRFFFSENVVCAEGGALFSKIILNAAERSLGGAERLFGIPGTVGGMLAMNAGAYGDSISNYLLDAEIFDKRDNSVKIFTSRKLLFSYRDSEIKRKKLIVLSARFSLVKREKFEILEELSKIRATRNNSQPLSQKNLGSVFKKCENYSASYLIDRCNLKGMRVGDIFVSNKHAGFFVNTGNGTASDFLKLCNIVKNKVKEKYGVTLSEEFEYLQ